MKGVMRMPLDFSLSPELLKVQRMAREMSREFAKRAPEHDRDRTMPTENYELLHDAGFYGLVIPAKYGGMGLGFPAWAVAAEELAKGCASTALSFNMHINATGAIMEHPEIAERFRMTFESCFQEVAVDMVAARPR